MEKIGSITRAPDLARHWHMCNNNQCRNLRPSTDPHLRYAIQRIVRTDNSPALCLLFSFEGEKVCSWDVPFQLVINTWSPRTTWFTFCNNMFKCNVRNKRWILWFTISQPWYIMTDAATRYCLNQWCYRYLIAYWIIRPHLVNRPNSLMDREISSVAILKSGIRAFQLFALHRFVPKPYFVNWISIKTRA